MRKFISLTGETACRGREGRLPLPLDIGHIIAPYVNTHTVKTYLHPPNRQSDTHIHSLVIPLDSDNWFHTILLTSINYGQFIIVLSIMLFTNSLVVSYRNLAESCGTLRNLAEPCGT